MEKELLNKLKYLIKKKGDLSIIAKELQLKDYELLGLIELLKKDGANIEVIGNTAAFCKAPITSNGEFIIPYKHDELKFLMLSDTHLASKYDNVQLLQQVYEEAERRGIRVALHCGDILDGRYPGRAGNEYELKYLSGPEQIDYTIEKYPRFNGQTYFITGNHDATWYKIAGIEVGKEIEKAREDMTYLGQDAADLKFGKTSFKLYHGSGGGSYARSYRGQKYLDNLQPKPDFAGFGHVHYSFYMQYLGTHVFQTASLQSMSPYIRAKGLPNDMGVWLVTAGIDNKGKVYDVQPELLEFSEGPTFRKKHRGGR